MAKLATALLTVLPDAFNLTFYSKNFKRIFVKGPLNERCEVHCGLKELFLDTDDGKDAVSVLNCCQSSSQSNTY